MKISSIHAVGCILAGMALGGLSGCDRKDAASYVDSAKAYAAKSDYKAAIIEIKNALQKEPGNPEARLLLSQSLMQTGDVSGAETEARKALDAGASADRAYPLLANSLVAQGQFATAIKQLGTRRLDSADARADLAVALAAAYAGSGDWKQAQSSIQAALVDQPGNVRALLLQAQFAGRSGDLDRAGKYIDLALKSSPGDVDALLMKAEFELAGHHADEAQKQIERAIAAHPDSLAAHAALISLAVTTGKVEIAKQHLANMKEIQALDFRTIYADALVAFVEGDNARAHASIQRLLAAHPDHLPSLMLSGLVDFQLGSYASAEETLRKVVARAPDDPITRRVLASIYLRTGRAAQALETLGPALQKTPDDPALLRIAGEAYLASGNAGLAESSYARANALDKTNIPSQIRLAQVRLAAGDTTRALTDLEVLSADDSSKGRADLALFAAHLKRREFDKALAAVDALEKKQPNSGVPSNLRGIVYLAKRDFKNARASFEKALEIQPNFYSAVVSLATLDIQEGNAQAARERYDKLLAKDPTNEQALLGSAEILALTGVSPDQVRNAFDKAVTAHPTSRRARLARINFEMRRHDGKAAVAIAQSALSAIPNDPQIVEALASAQTMSGDVNQAVDTLKQLVVLQPQNPMALLRLAELQTSIKDYAAALESERKALVIKPDLSQAWGAIAKTYVLSGRPDAAITEARKLQKQEPANALGYLLEAEVLMVQKKWVESVTSYRVALTHQPVPMIAARLYVVLQAAGKKSEAAAMAEKWIKEHPKDSTLPQLMAQQSQQRKEYGAAVDGYKRVLDIDPDNVPSLNNIAWILTEQGDPKAVEYAERAHRLAPFSPNVLDTLGWSLARTGDPKRGAQLLRMASAIAPAQNDIRLHLAKALLDSGDKASARQMLTELSKLEKDSPIRIEAEKLLATL